MAPNLSATPQVITEATVESITDSYRVKAGWIEEHEIRRLTIPAAVVSPNTTPVALPTRMIQQLGLEKRGTKRVVGSLGIGAADIYEPVRLTIQGRECTMDVMEVPNNFPALIGHIPLTHLDLVVDLRNRVLIGNPALGGEHVYEMY